MSLGFMMAGLFVVFGVIWTTLKTPVHAASEGGTLVTVHDRGEETTFVTNQATLREAFAENDISVDTQDAIEPSLDEELVAPDYQVNVYRARPVTVIDGAMRQKIVTPYQSAERIVKDAGIELYAEDTTTLTRSDDIIGDGAGLQLKISRAVPVELNLYGSISTVRTQGKTVGEFLTEKSIALGDNARVSPSEETAIREGLVVRVWQEGKQTITVEEAVAHSTEQVKDADRPVGYKEVQTLGQDGKRSVTYEIEIKDGVEVSRTEIASLALTEPVTQVEVIGTKPNYIPYSGGGTKTDWLAASNIPEMYWGYADWMVMRESGWNPNAVNASSGACGLAQALPCSKLGPNWNNPVVALNWMNNYVNGRYGGWEGAYTFWQVNHWY